MLGAVIGNIVGSRYHSKKDRIKIKDFVFFDDSCHFKIDTVCTAAVLDILLNDRQPATTLQEWCRRYPHLGRESLNSGLIPTRLNPTIVLEMVPRCVFHQQRS